MPNHMFNGASKFKISGGTFVINTSEKSALDRLSAATAHSALHDAPARTDESRCHPHTRINVLDRLERWARGLSNEDTSIFWLHGGAGAGKSAIMQTLGERCVAEGLALGCFFFSRTDSTRNTAETLIPALTYQLAQLFPSSHQILNRIIDCDPLIFKKSFKVQLINSLALSLQHLVQLRNIRDAPQSPRVFLIDGLDECNDPRQQKAIIRAAAAVCHEHRIPVKFLIASRPEPAISASFRQYQQENHILGSESLSNDPNAEADIRRFIEDEFREICLQHTFKEMIPSKWPALYDINKLVWKSSSHFIYASTAMKYISSTTENPVRSLQVVLGLEASRTTSPFPELDALYHHILGSAAHRDKVLQILGHCIFSSLSPSVRIICIMLEYSVDDVFIFLADIAALAEVTPGPGKMGIPSFKLDSRVRLLHQSLHDFLTDQSRSQSLYVDVKGYLASKLERCLQLLDLYSRDQCTTPDWPSSKGDSYSPLIGQIKKTIKLAVDTIATQEVLSRYPLRALHDCQMRFLDLPQPAVRRMCGLFVAMDLLAYVKACKQLGVGDGGHLFKSFLTDFIGIIISHLHREGGPFTPAILPLLFASDGLRHFASALAKVNYHNSIQYHQDPGGGISTALISQCIFSITTGDLASIRHHFSGPTLNLTAAAEVILKNLLLLHKQACTDDKAMKHDVAYSETIHTFVHLLGHCSYSHYIISYSTELCLKRFRSAAYLLHGYITRVRAEKLQALSQQIDEGNMDALAEKSRMFDLNKQD